MPHFNTIYQIIKPFLNKKCLFLRNMEPLNFLLTFSSLQSNTDIFANSVDPDKTGCNEPSNQGLCYSLLTETTICNNGCVQS